MIEGWCGTETILLAEDDACVRAITARTLRSLGYTVLEAAHGVEALEVAVAHTAPIHLLLADVVMPQLNGSSLARELRQARPELRVLFVSGYAADVLTRADLQSDFPFMAKPYAPTLLAHRVREILDAKLSDRASSARPDPPP